MQFAFFFYPDGIQKLFWKIIAFVESGNDANSRGWGWGDHILCVNMTQCVRKSISDSPLN